MLRAFFEPAALAAWWQASASVTTPRVLGPYVIEWQPTEFRDDVLGRLGGVLRGTVMQVDPAEGFFLADVYWLPPDGDPIGPMAIEVSWRSARPPAGDVAQAEAQDDTTDAGESTTVSIRQTGFEDSPRWRRYYAVFGAGWGRALAALKDLLER